MQPQPQKRVAQAYRIEGSIVLDRLTSRTSIKANRSLLPTQPWWIVVFGVPLFLHTLIRLLIACPHRHKGPPMTLRESIPSNLSGCRSVCGRHPSGSWLRLHFSLTLRHPPISTLFPYTTLHQS